MRVVFAYYVSIPFIIGALSFLYHAWEHDGEYGLWMAPFLVIAAMIWVFSPQINWWWYSKRPPALEAGVLDALVRYVPFYQKLDASDRQRFCDRLALTRMSTDFTTKGMPDDTALPPDIMSAIATQSVIATWHKTAFIFDKLENVVVSPGPFLTPEHPYYHNAETFEPESCLLFSAKAALDAFIRPTQMFNVVLHEYVKAAFAKYGSPTVALDENAWDSFEKISGWNRQTIESAIGLAGIDPLPVAVCHYYLFADQFRKEMPELAKKLDGFLGQAA